MFIVLWVKYTKVPVRVENNSGAHWGVNRTSQKFVPSPPADAVPGDFNALKCFKKYTCHWKEFWMNEKTGILDKTPTTNYQTPSNYRFLQSMLEPSIHKVAFGGLCTGLKLIRKLFQNLPLFLQK